jgi:hypothetical protein
MDSFKRALEEDWSLADRVSSPRSLLDVISVFGTCRLATLVFERHSNVNKLQALLSICCEFIQFIASKINRFFCLTSLNFTLKSR